VLTKIAHAIRSTAPTTGEAKLQDDKPLMRLSGKF